MQRRQRGTCLSNQSKAPPAAAAAAAADVFTVSFVAERCVEDPLFAFARFPSSLTCFLLLSHSCCFALNAASIAAYCVASPSFTRALDLKEGFKPAAYAQDKAAWNSCPVPHHPTKVAVACMPPSVAPVARMTWV